MIHVREKKHPQSEMPIEVFFDAKKLYLPLSQHTGNPSESTVAPKDAVAEGQCIAKMSGFVSASLHAPKNATVTSIAAYGHPVFKKWQAITLTSQPELKTYTLRANVDTLENQQLLAAIQEAGIVGMGGACFPTHIKLKPQKPVDTLIINGCECEPYLTCDYRLMVEHSEAICSGIEIACRLLAPQRVMFAIEDNKPEAIKKFNLLITTKKFNLPSASVAVLKSRYPQGGEKQLIQHLVGRRVPPDGLPFDVGCLVHNVGTLFAIHEAIYYGKPLIERVVTFSGGALAQAKNLRVKVGTSLRELFDSGVLSLREEPAKIIYGGPMMGIALEGLDYPVMKGTSGILFLSKEEADKEGESSCIKCARCVDACPMCLLPLEYAKLVKHEEFEKLKSLYIKDCIECGCCTYVCPAKIPLVHYIKQGKHALVKESLEKR